MGTSGHALQLSGKPGQRIDEDEEGRRSGDGSGRAPAHQMKQRREENPAANSDHAGQESGSTSQQGFSAKAEASTASPSKVMKTRSGTRIKPPSHASGMDAAQSGTSRFHSISPACAKRIVEPVTTVMLQASEMAGRIR